MYFESLWDRYRVTEKSSGIRQALLDFLRSNSMASETMSMIIMPPSEPHTHTVVFLHGRGDNARNFARSLVFWRDSHGRSPFQAFPSFRWVFPQAPMRQCASSPDICPQWFDVWNVKDFADREELQAEGLREVVPQIRRLLANEANLLGDRWDRVILAGISMGAATSAHVLFHLDIPVAGSGRLGAFLGISCRCPFLGRPLPEMRKAIGLEDGVPDHANVIRNTPVLLEHCVDDPLVRLQNGYGMRDTLREFGAEVEWKEYPSGGHWFNTPAGMDDVVEFINRRVLGKSSEGQTERADDAMDLS